MQIHNPFKELETDIEALESQASAAGDVDFFFVHSSDIEKRIDAVLHDIRSASDHIYDILTESENSKGQTLEGLLVDALDLYAEIKQKTLQNVADREDWVKIQEDANKAAVDLRADYYASVL